MKFLCLPGAYGSADKFQVQLAPLIRELLSDDSASFHFINAPCKAVPPKGFEDFFGKPPYYRFIEPDESSDDEGDALSRIRDFPERDTPEDTMRELMNVGGASSYVSTQKAIQFLYKIMETEGPFEGIIGYSEGAAVAATLPLQEQRWFQKTGRPPMIKCAVFFAGWPPLDPVTYSMVLADESDLMIDVHTCHIIGSLDPYVAGSLALYNTCDPDKAYIFDHGKGHTLPREKGVVKELGDVIRTMISDVSS
ncbi:serine hydrolase FSH [Pseudomassariella vexata]|uniref:Serine hydrolase FSH n=1 Tax=Pseudomassariella vexata TaxID=1141098 RepID=A0A1Y2DXF4_9PEZI|nr:serine hydrolase FSH [Pseudomassariella vexata]ORY63889.1 serine hydrolase FSH [Pseudomassariella vexata]